MEQIDEETAQVSILPKMDVGLKYPNKDIKSGYYVSILPKMDVGLK